MLRDMPPGATMTDGTEVDFNPFPPARLSLFILSAICLLIYIYLSVLFRITVYCLILEFMHLILPPFSRSISTSLSILGIASAKGMQYITGLFRMMFELIAAFDFCMSHFISLKYASFRYILAVAVADISARHSTFLCQLQKIFFSVSPAISFFPIRMSFQSKAVRLRFPESDRQREFRDGGCRSS